MRLNLSYVLGKAGFSREEGEKDEGKTRSLGRSRADPPSLSVSRLSRPAGIVACPSCGAAKRAHHLCHECHVDFRRTFHQEVKDKDAGVPVER